MCMYYQFIMPFIDVNLPHKNVVSKHQQQPYAAHIKKIYKHFRIMDTSVFFLIISFRDWKFETENRFRLIECVVLFRLV